MYYINKISPLEEMTSAQVAISLCQQNSFKEIALLIEKPSYDVFLRFDKFVSDPKKLAVWAHDYVVKDLWSCFDFERSCCLNDAEKVRLWDAAIEEQCGKILEGIPNPLRKGVHIWIVRIALEYLSFSRRQEVLFGVSRCFWVDVLTSEDWTKAGRLDEKRLALRILQDERLTVLQRYRIACEYCLHTQIPELRGRLTEEEKLLTSGENKDDLSRETHDLVLLWSRHLDRKEEDKVESQTNQLWTDALRKAALYGNCTTVMQCWEMLEERAPQLIVFDMALLSLKSVLKLHACGRHNKQRLVSNSLHPDIHNDKKVDFSDLPSCHIEVMCFFLSKMGEEQQLTFFKRAFQSGYTGRILECFLDWPHHDDFLPTINRLWGIIPKDMYRQCLLTLTSKYSAKGNEENCYCDHRSLLGKLWRETPEEYKQYVFSDYEYDYASFRYSGYAVLTLLLDRSPFQEKDEYLFKLVFRDLPLEKRRCLINPHSQIGENICSLLMQKENWPFVNWLLEACLPKEEISDFKKELILTDVSLRLCFDELKQNRKNLVTELIDWGFVSDTDKKQFKRALRKLRSDEARKPHLCIGECTLWCRLKNCFTSTFEWNGPIQYKPLRIPRCNGTSTFVRLSKRPTGHSC